MAASQIKRDDLSLSNSLVLSKFQQKVIGQSRAQTSTAANQNRAFNLTSNQFNCSNESNKFNQLKSKFKLLDVENYKLQIQVQTSANTITNLKLQIEKLQIHQTNSNSLDSQSRFDQDSHFDLASSNQQNYQIMIPKKIKANSHFKRHRNDHYLKTNGHPTKHTDFESANFINVDHSKEYIHKLNQFSKVWATEYINVEMSKPQENDLQNEVSLTLKFLSDPNNTFLKMFRKMLHLKPLSQQGQDPKSNFYTSEIRDYPSQNPDKPGNYAFDERVQPVPSSNGYSPNPRSGNRYPKQLEGITERTMEFSPDPEKNYGYDEFEKSQPKKQMLLSTLNNSKGQQHSVQTNGNHPRDFNPTNKQTAPRQSQDPSKEGNGTDPHSYNNYIESNQTELPSHILKTVADNEFIRPRNRSRQGQIKSQHHFEKRFKYNKFSPDSPRHKQTFHQETSLNNSRDIQNHKSSRLSHAVKANNNTSPHANQGSMSTIRNSKFNQVMMKPDFYYRIFKKKRFWTSNSKLRSSVEHSLQINEKNAKLPEIMFKSLVDLIQEQDNEIKRLGLDNKHRFQNEIINLRDDIKDYLEVIEDYKEKETLFLNQIKIMKGKRF